MCLSYVLKSDPRLEGAYTSIGCKVMVKLKDGLYGFPHLVNEKPIAIDEWVSADTRTELSDCYGEIYQSGFHVFRDLRAAVLYWLNIRKNGMNLPYVILHAQITEVNTRGLQGDHYCSVAGKMMLRQEISLDAISIEIEDHIRRETENLAQDAFIWNNLKSRVSEVSEAQPQAFKKD